MNIVFLSLHTFFIFLTPYIKKLNWITNNDTIIFNPKFNAELDIGLISKYTKLIFSNYELNKELFESYANGNFYGLLYKTNKFNQNIYELPNSLTLINFGNNFNREIVNLPNFLTHLTLIRMCLYYLEL